MVQRASIYGLTASLTFIFTSVFGLESAPVAAQGLGAKNGIVIQSADCNLVYEWSTKLTFFDESHPGFALVSDAFGQLRTGMTRDEVASKMAYLGFDESATKLCYLFVDGIGDYRPHHRAELRFRDDRLYSIRTPDTLTVLPEPDGLQETSSLVAPPDTVETALTVYLDCKGSVSDEYQLAHMGVWQLSCGMNHEDVAWALHPIPVSNVVDKWLLVVRERPLVNIEHHLIVFDGQSVGFVVNDHDSKKPWE